MDRWTKIEPSGLDPWSGCPRANPARSGLLGGLAPDAAPPTRPLRRGPSDAALRTPPSGRGPSGRGASSARRQPGRLVERRARLRREAPPDPPAGAAEREVGHRGEAGLVLAQGEQEVRDAVAGREVAPRHADAEAVRAAGAGRDEHG